MTENERLDGSDSETQLWMDFRIEAPGEDPVERQYGAMTFGDGDAFLRAAEWCGKPLHEFLWAALRDRVKEIAVVMREEEPRE